MGEDDFLEAAYEDRYAVDNASNVDDPYDTHPCGPGPVLHHSWDENGECEDCGIVYSDEPDEDED